MIEIMVDLQIRFRSPGDIMTRISMMALLIALGGSANAFAQLPGQTALSPSPIVHSTTEIAVETVNVRDFGAKGDGSNDDTAALNAAVAYIRTNRSIGSGEPGITSQAYAATLVIPQGRYKVTSSLNWTGLASLSLEIDCQGCIIDGQTNGAPVIDALGSRWLRVNGLTIWGDDREPPSIGLQIGRTTGASADDHHFENLTLSGVFTFAALYVFAAETTMFDHLMVWNQSTSPSAFGVVLDGINHWHANSVFTPVTAAIDTPQSFNELLFMNPSIMTTAGASSPIWMAGTSRARFVTGYAANTRTACGMTLYATDAWPIVQLSMDVHFENPELKDVFCIDGPPNTPQASIRGLAYSDNYPEASNALFKVSENVTSVVMRDAGIRIDNFFSTRAKVFDQPERWTVSGRYSEVSGDHWNLPPARFDGYVDAGGHVRFKGMLQSTSTPPAMSSAPCAAGQIAADSRYIYICVTTNQWKRTPLESW